MNEVYIFGHRNPDTDSIMSSISLAYLKQRLGMNAKAVALSSLNNETLFVLNYFKVKEPAFINDVRVRIKDLDYLKGHMIDRDNILYDSYKLIIDNKVNKIPVIDDNKKLLGIIGLRDIMEVMTNSNSLDTTYDDIVRVLNGISIKKDNNIVKGIVSVDEVSDIIVTGNDRVFVGGLNNNAKLIIVSNDYELSNDYLFGNTSIIKSSYNLYDTIRLLSLSNKVRNLKIDKDCVVAREEDTISSFNNMSSKSKNSFYPVLDRKGRCLGLIKHSMIFDTISKKVILVDHNSKEQSAVGLEEADIIEIVDHHNLSVNSTTKPISFRNIPVGSTCTIVYKMFLENKVTIPKWVAGLLLSGIISDTLLLNSPTSTKDDRKAVKELSKLAKVNYKEYGFNMLKAGTSLEGKTKEQVLYNDFKKYNLDDNKIGLGQIFTTNISDIEDEKNEYINLLNEVCLHNDYLFVCLFVTDIIKNGTYVYYSDGAEGILGNAFDTKIFEGVYLPNVVSRKMQILPSILSVSNY